YPTLFRSHVGDLHRHGGLANGRLQRVLPRHEIGLAGRHVGVDHVEYGTIVGRVDHHAVHHGAPVGDLGLYYAGLLGQALQDAGGDEILDLDVQLAALAPYRDAGLCLFVLDETAVLGVVAQLDDLDVVRVGLLLAQAVPFGQPGVAGQLLAQADHGDRAVLVGPGVQLGLDRLQVHRRERMAEGNDLDQTLAQQAVEVGIAAQPLHAQVLAGQVHRLVVLDSQVVVVDAPVGEAKLRRRWRIARAQRRALGRLGAFSALFRHDQLQAFRG